MKCEFDALGVFATIQLNGSGSITLRASQIRAERTGIHAAVSVFFNTTRLAYDTFNVTRNEERNRLSKDAHTGLSAVCQKEYHREALKNDLDNFCAELWDTWQERDPAQEIWVNPDDKPVPPEWLLEPLVLTNQPNIFFGERSAAKSLTCLIIATTLAMQWEKNPFGLIPPANYSDTLYLDFERNDSMAKYNLARLARGMKLPALSIHYKRLFGPLSRNIEWVRRYLSSRPTIRLVIIDSITPACGGNLNDSTGASDMFEAERSLNTTTLFLAHASNKDPEAKHKTVIGHSAFEAYAGNVWECRKIQEEESSTADICLYHRKPPAVYRARKPIAYRTIFNETDFNIVVTPTDPKSISEFLERMDLKTRIIDCLRRGAKTTSTISTELNEKYPSVSVTLSRLRSNGAIIETGKEGKASLWGLTQL